MKNIVRLFHTSVCIALISPLVLKIADSFVLRGEWGLSGGLLLCEAGERGERSSSRHADSKSRDCVKYYCIV